MVKLKNLFILVSAGSLAACVHLPSGPSVMTLPGSNMSFDQFRSDESECRQYAQQQLGGSSPRQASRASGVEGAAVGTGLGAAAGAAFGGGEGAIIGAGLGLLMGSLMGSSSATTSGYANQERYDNSYIQCMYAKGHRVPINGKIINGPSNNTSRRITSPGTDFIPPPPPPGNPPPPPPQ
ncbi:MAG: YMGG-like glycine zipper-containing protein [Nitrosomonas sp.]